MNKTKTIFCAADGRASLIQTTPVGPFVRQGRLHARPNYVVFHDPVARATFDPGKLTTYQTVRGYERAISRLGAG